nr:putative phage tail protein [Sedimentibacter sp.]
MYGQNLFGTLRYGTDTQNEIIPEDHYVRLMKYLPDCYQNSAQMNDLQQSIGKEFGVLSYNIDELLNQMYVDTATWGLELWEKQLGIQTDISKSNTARREIIKAKLRGAGTTTKSMIKNTAMAFSGGDVDVIEYPKENKFVIQFVGVLGIPPNMAGLIQSIEEIKPAHLSYSFKYTYTVWNNFNDLKWNDINTKTWAELKIYEGE